MMDPVEELLASNEEDLGAVDLERLLRLLSQEVQRHREEISKQRTELQELRTQEADRTQCRERYTSLFLQILDLHEALEEEEETRQKLREMERLSDMTEPESSEVLESRLKEMQNIIAAYQEKEKKLKGESEHLKRLLEKATEELTEATCEHQRVTEELGAVQAARPDHGCRGLSDIELLLDSCVREVRALNVFPDKK